MELNQQLVNAIIPILVAIVFSFAAGGATVAAVLVLVLRQIANSPVIITTLKQLYMGLAPEWKDLILTGDELVDKVTGETPAPAV